MSLRALAFCLFLILSMSACAQAVPTESLEPVFPLPGSSNTGSSDVTPPGSPTTESQLPAIISSSSGTGEAQNAAQISADRRFRLQTGSMVALANFAMPEAGCNWLGVGGQAFDLSGNPLTMLVVEVGGTLEGSDVFHLALTGSAAVIGPGGFVITLADHGLNSSGQVWIILYDLAGDPLTGRIYFPTYADCTKNFILINFSETTITDANKVLIPSILK